MANPAFLGTVSQFFLAANDLSGDSTQISMPVAVGKEDITVFGDYWDEFLPTTGSATIDLAMFYDKAAGKNAPVVWALLPTSSAVASTSAFTYNPYGGATGQPTYTGTCFPTKYHPQSKPKGAVTLAATLQITGAVTRGTHA